MAPSAYGFLIFYGIGAGPNILSELRIKLCRCLDYTPVGV